MLLMAELYEYQKIWREFFENERGLIPFLRSRIDQFSRPLTDNQFRDRRKHFVEGLFDCLAITSLDSLAGNTDLGISKAAKLTQTGFESPYRMFGAGYLNSQTGKYEALVSPTYSVDNRVFYDIEHSFRRFMINQRTSPQFGNCRLIIVTPQFGDLSADKLKTFTTVVSLPIPGDKIRGVAFTILEHCSVDGGNFARQYDMKGDLHPNGYSSATLIEIQNEAIGALQGLFQLVDSSSNRTQFPFDRLKFGGILYNHSQDEYGLKMPKLFEPHRLPFYIGPKNNRSTNR